MRRQSPVCFHCGFRVGGSRRRRDFGSFGRGISLSNRVPMSDAFKNFAVENDVGVPKRRGSGSADQISNPEPNAPSVGCAQKRINPPLVHRSRFSTPPRPGGTRPCPGFRLRRAGPVPAPGAVCRPADGRQAAVRAIFKDWRLRNPNRRPCQWRGRLSPAHGGYFWACPRQNWKGRR